MGSYFHPREEKISGRSPLSQHLVRIGALLEVVMFCTPFETDELSWAAPMKWELQQLHLDSAMCAKERFFFQETQCGTEFISKHATSFKVRLSDQFQMLTCSIPSKQSIRIVVNWTVSLWNSFRAFQIRCRLFPICWIGVNA